ncbi:MAG TPA: endolytic transglycosylase MltG [Dissulfurispiraceae bacterium]
MKVIVAAIFFIFAAYIGMQLFVPSNIGNSTQVEVEIPQGATYKQAINILYTNNLIRDKNLFIVLGKLSGLDRKIRYGYYSFLGKMSPFQVFKILRSGKIIEYEVTVVEGDGLLEIAKKLAAFKLVSVDDFNYLSRKQDFLGELGVEAPSLEGYLFPQTYKIPKGASPKNILKMMVEKLREEYTDELEKRMGKLKWNENKVLTLASIIEKEAVTDEERPIISAVYHNRLKKGMPLQADPTAIYGVKSSKERITINDLKKKTDYNTYIIKGLPPGPIASPGLKSIKAALYPANVPYLYFVSQGNGTHYFSRTWQEHVEAVKRFREIQNGSRLRPDDSPSIEPVAAQKPADTKKKESTKKKGRKRTHH